MKKKRRKKRREIIPSSYIGWIIGWIRPIQFRFSFFFDVGEPEFHYQEQRNYNVKSHVEHHKVRVLSTRYVARNIHQLTRVLGSRRHSNRASSKEAAGLY
jgi:hypothetical protein